MKEARSGLAAAAAVLAALLPAPRPSRAQDVSRVQKSVYGTLERLTVEEYSQVTETGKSTVYEAVRRGMLPAIRIGHRVLIPRTALQARYRRVKRHRGHKKAIVAVGHQMLEIAYYIMRDEVTYQELGADYFLRRDAERATRRHVRQLEALGYHVTIEKAA